jgi:hypothetical protein
MHRAFQMTEVADLSTVPRQRLSVVGIQALGWASVLLFTLPDLATLISKRGVVAWYALSPEEITSATGCGLLEGL